MLLTNPTCAVSFVLKQINDTKLLFTLGTRKQSPLTDVLFVTALHLAHPGHHQASIICQLANPFRGGRHLPQLNTRAGTYGLVYIILCVVKYLSFEDSTKPELSRLQYYNVCHRHHKKTTIYFYAPQANNSTLPNVKRKVNLNAAELSVVMNISTLYNICY